MRSRRRSGEAGAGTSATGGAADGDDRVALPGAVRAGRADRPGTGRPGIPAGPLCRFVPRSRRMVSRRPGRGEGAGSGRQGHRGLRRLPGTRGLPGTFAAALGRHGAGGSPVPASPSSSKSPSSSRSPNGPVNAPAPGQARPAGLRCRPPGHDHFRASIYFRTQAPVLPVRSSAVARPRPGQLEALHLRGGPGGSRTRPRHGPRLGVLPHLPRPAQADHVLRAAARHRAPPGVSLA